MAEEFTRPFVIGRGFSSLPPRHEIATRFRRSGREKLVLLVASDHDPEGDDIPHALARSLRDDFRISDVHAVKFGLTADPVRALGLVPNLTAKQTSSRWAGFTQQYCHHTYELEAIPPDRLQEFVRAAVVGVLDMDRFRAEQEREQADARMLHQTRTAARLALRDDIGS